MAEFLPFLMFVALAVFIMIGYPVAFTLGGLALVFGLLGFGLDFFTLLPMRIWGRMSSFTLVAVPLFIFMGVFLDRSGLAEDLLDTMALLFGRIRGGVAVSVVVVGAMLAASTGIMGATVVTMGVISLPLMLKRKYSTELATGTICAASTLGQIIPPSISLVILGDIMGISVGELFMGAVIPGLMLVGLYIAYILIYSWRHPESAPGLSDEEMASITPKELTVRVFKALLPPAGLILTVLGSIFLGVASPTEAASVGALGAMLLTVVRGRMSLDVLKDVMRQTTRFTSMAFLILLGATTFGLVFRFLGGDAALKHFVSSFGGGVWGVMILVMGVLFVLGFFLDFIEITFIIMPILAPIVDHLGINPMWFCILVCLNFQTSFLTPPFGFALFYLKGVCPPEVQTTQIYKGIIPFVAIQLTGMMLVVVFPELCTWLPGVLFK
ncbi:TRAP transporter large permease [Dethiosulfatarculus sandiegensis]|uniref:C4-dicarboxylate ABC transporter n=1 Tax=Dethiosulfatarculus sandiegensis TaxID=1429043 RepID=A0A0D2GLP5_9BACT|nr:TRAP transporter large permease subunit [Dethiosulfatarculus sandiegensis]KIX15592.1 C4-dicarboxylate ABC transporter [Dethiosulfatarculus sandiegensis]